MNFEIASVLWENSKREEKILFFNNKLEDSFISDYIYAFPIKYVIQYYFYFKLASIFWDYGKT